jgi:hypothetical protein
MEIRLDSTTFDSLRADPNRQVQWWLRRLRTLGSLRQTSRGGWVVIDLDAASMAGAMGIRDAVARAELRVAADRALRTSDPVWDYLVVLFATVSKNARRRDRECTLTRGQLQRLYRQSRRCCAVTGMPFSLLRYGTSRSPFAPSIDRIDNSRGYEAGNVRLVCQMVNLAMNVWGVKPVNELLAAVAAGPAPAPLLAEGLDAPPAPLRRGRKRCPVRPSPSHVPLDRLPVGLHWDTRDQVWFLLRPGLKARRRRVNLTGAEATLDELLVLVADVDRRLGRGS